METEPRKDRQCLTTPRKLSVEVELGRNDGNVRFRDWNYNVYHVVFIKRKYFLLLPMLLVKNERVMQSDSVVGMTNKALLASNVS